MKTMDDQLKQLFDYTKFHIGMYTTLITAIIGVSANSHLSGQYKEKVPYISVSVFFFLVAGAAGGLIASSIPFYTTFDEFCGTRLGPWRFRWIPSIICTHIEHTAFWLGFLVAALGLWIVLLKSYAWLHNIFDTAGFWSNTSTLLAGFMAVVAAYITIRKTQDAANDEALIRQFAVAARVVAVLESAINRLSNPQSDVSEKNEVLPWTVFSALANDIGLLGVDDVRVFVEIERRARELEARPESLSSTKDVEYLLGKMMLLRKWCCERIGIHP